MFSKHKRRNNISSINNYNKYNNTVKLDERGLQDSLKAAQIIFQRHTTNTNNKGSSSKDNNNVYGNNVSSASTPCTISQSKESNKNNNNIKRLPRNQTNTKSIPIIKHNDTSLNNTNNQIKRRQQNSTQEDMVNPPSRRKNEHHSNHHDDIVKLRPPNQLPISLQSSRSPSPSNDSVNSSSGNTSVCESLVDNADYDDLSAQSPVDRYIDTPKQYLNPSSDFTKSICLGNNNLKGNNIQVSKNNNLNNIYGCDASLLQKDIQSKGKLLKDKQTELNIPRQQILGTKINENNASQLGNPNNQELSNSHYFPSASKHYRIPPPILVNSKAVDSMNSLNLVSSLTNNESNASTINDLFMSSLESISANNSYRSFQEEDYTNYKNEQNEWINKNMRKNGSQELFLQKSFNSDSDFNNATSDHIKNYNSSEDEASSESEIDERDYDDVDIFTLGSVDPDNISAGSFSDDDILINNGVRSPQKSKKSKGEKVKKIGKILKVTGKKVHVPDLKTKEDKSPTNFPIRLKETMRQDTSKSFNEDKPWKKHKDAKYIEENDRKRYEGVWVRNRFAYLNLLPWWPQDTSDRNDSNLNDSNKIVGDDKEASEDSTLHKSTSSDSEDIEPFVDLPEDGLILNLVVKAIWQRSNLPNETLFQIYNLVDTRQDGTLDRRSFIVGMWLVDQCLYGRKLPEEVPPIVWNSVDSYTMNLIQVRMAHESKQKQKKSKRKLMKRELRHIKQGIKHVHL
ncbi:Tax4p PWA37_004376 [Arxiozyma heterogenica]|uniref:EH domain-containing protein n=1 Tax=Arxiozyma heterogenica TaxID=278026 RepID=A0AAN7WJM0_9SACH|nr:hypothetical protein RI543_003390 [Kazachstania heterogenica]